MDVEILEQHKKIYVGASKELILNNTKSLFEDDILPFFMMPPLETMDVIKQRFLSIAKGYQLILDTAKLDECLQQYRNCLKQDILNIHCTRDDLLIKKIESFDYENIPQLLKELKKELLKLDKSIKKEIKQVLKEKNQEFLLNHISDLVTTESDILPFTKEITRFLQNIYIKQILESIDMKILVKDTTLLNGMKEQLDRFIFTTENSHLFD